MGLHNIFIFSLGALRWCVEYELEGDGTGMSSEGYVTLHASSCLGSVRRNREQAELPLGPGAAVPSPAQVLWELRGRHGQPGDNQHRAQPGPLLHAGTVISFSLFFASHAPGHTGKERSACLCLMAMLFWPAGAMSVGRDKRYQDTRRERTLPWWRALSEFRAVTACPKTDQDSARVWGMQPTSLSLFWVAGERKTRRVTGLTRYHLVALASHTLSRSFLFCVGSSRLFYIL